MKKRRGGGANGPEDPRQGTKPPVAVGRRTRTARLAAEIARREARLAAQAEHGEPEHDGFPPVQRRVRDGLAAHESSAAGAPPLRRPADLASPEHAPGMAGMPPLRRPADPASREHEPGMAGMPPLSRRVGPAGAGVAAAPAQAVAAARDASVATAVERIVALLDEITGDAEEQEILSLLGGLSPGAYAAVIAGLQARHDGDATYLERLYDDLHGEEFHAWLALDRAKRLAARAGRPEALADTLARIEFGPTGAPDYHYAPSHITDPTTWSRRSYPHDARYDRYGGVRAGWRTHTHWADVHGVTKPVHLAPGDLVSVRREETGRTEAMTAAQVKALADQHEFDAVSGKINLIGVAIGVGLVGAARSTAGKLATGLFEVVLPAAGQFVSEHRAEIERMAGGRRFLRAWQIFDLAMAGFGVVRLAWGASRGLARRVRTGADELAAQNPDSAIAGELAAHAGRIDAALDEAAGAGRLVAAGADELQAVRVAGALESAGLDTGAIAALDDGAAVALCRADRAIADGRLADAQRQLDTAGLDPAVRARVESELAGAHGRSSLRHPEALVADGVTPDGKPVPPLSDRVPEDRVSRAGGGLSDNVPTRVRQRRVRARRRELEAVYGKRYVDQLEDSEIHAEALFRGGSRGNHVTLGEPEAARKLGMTHKVKKGKGRTEERPMVDLVTEDHYGRLGPVEVKNQTEVNFSSQQGKDSVSNKFAEIADHAPPEVLDRIDHFTLIVHRDSVLRGNYKLTAAGELWELVDGTAMPSVWRRVTYGGKPVIVRRGDLGKISK